MDSSTRGNTRTILKYIESVIQIKGCALQQRIQDFPREDANPEVGANLLFGYMFTKIAQKFLKIGPKLGEGFGCVQNFISATTLIGI